jgi:hypothetical protein
MQLFVDGQPEELVDISAEFGPGTSGLYIGGIPADKLPHDGNRHFSGRVENLWISSGLVHTESFNPLENPENVTETLVWFRADAVSAELVQDLTGGDRSGQWRATSDSE